MIYLYTALLYAITPLVLARLAWRGLRNPDYLQRLPERFGYVAPLAETPVIWIHAVSVGEARAAAPLVKAFVARYPDHRILITTMTPTGSATVRAVYGDTVAHCYVPYDLPGAVRRFLVRTRPVIAIMMETELWPNIFRLCHARGIPVCVANMRMSEASMHRYLKIRALTARTLAHVALLGAQSTADAERIRRLGAAPSAVHVTGSVKFEIDISASLREAADSLRARWGRERPVWLAASTHEGEEELVLQAYAQLAARFPDQLLVLVPRHPERFAHVARLAQRAGLRTVLRSAHRGLIDAQTQVLIGDTLGELPLFYGAVDCAFVGGSLVPTGGHNLLEAAAMGKPVVFGPHMHNFAEIASLTLERGAGTQARSMVELVPAIADFIGNANRRFEAGEAGRRLVEENRGAAARTLKLIERCLAD